MKNSKPFKLQDFLPYKLNTMADIMTKDVAKVYSTYHNLTRSQWRIVAILNEHGPLTSGQVCKLISMEKVMASRSIAVLENKKLIKRLVNKEDKRSKYLALTPKCNRVLQKLLPSIVQWETGIKKKYGSKNFKLLDSMLDDIKSMYD